jgi:hypothetical protein
MLWARDCGVGAGLSGCHRSQKATMRPFVHELNIGRARYHNLSYFGIGSLEHFIFVAVLTVRISQ